MTSAAHIADQWDMLCAQASQDAYSLRGFSAGGEVNQQIIQSDLAHCLIRSAEGATIVAFRGTQNIRDWLSDADAHKVTVNSGGEGKCHAGFWNAWQSISPQVLGTINSKYISSQQVFITGHSLGGALAVLCARSMALNKFPFERIVDFGQPRVFDAPGAALCDKLFGDRHIRFTNRADIVPWIPWLANTYKHSGNELYFPPGSGACLWNPSLLTKLFDNGLELFAEYRQGRWAALADHAIENYIARLRALMPSTLNPQLSTT